MIKIDDQEVIFMRKEPIGGVCCDSSYGGRTYYYQAMLFGGGK